MSVPIRTVVVDDEDSSRALLTSLLAPHRVLDVVGAFSDATAATNAILSLRPDLLFLDVQMPGGSGFDVVEAVRDHWGEAPLPVTVFVTGFDTHAVAAFDAGALDYVLKPVDDGRLAAAVHRARELVHARRERGGIPSLGEEDGPEPDRAPSRVHRLPMRVDDRIRLVPVGDATWFESDGKQIRVHLAAARGHALEFAVRRPMHVLERQLDPDVFVRVSRSAIVNLDHLLHAEPWLHGEYVLVMRDGARVLTTAGHRHRIQRILRGE